jgi:hypothetical protein
MKLNDRLTKTEGLQSSAMLPAKTLMRIIYQPSETGPGEVGAFVNVLTITGYVKMQRGKNELQRAFEARVGCLKLQW